MQEIPEKWRSVRGSEYSRLRSLLGSNAALIHVMGTKGCGKSSIVDDLCHHRTTVSVDANICGSVFGVMSSILRRLSFLKTLTREDESSESESEIKEQKDVKSEISVETPDDPTKNVYEGVVRNRRKAAEIANLKLAAAPRRKSASQKRKALDRFIDEDDSDSDATEGGSENDDEGGRDAKDTNETIRIGNLKNSFVYHDILKVLNRAQEMRVRGQSAFIQKLERVVLKNNKRTVLILDNIDKILTRVDFDIDSSSIKTPGSDFLKVLTHLDEYLSIPSQLSIVLVTSQMLPNDISSRCATVHLHAYSKAECEMILKRGDDKFDAFLSTALAVLYPAYSGNFAMLRDTVNRLFDSSVVIQQASRNALAAKAKLVCGEELKRAFGGGEEVVSFDEQVNDRKECLSSTKWLSSTEKLVLIAGYLASHNPPNQDKVLFRTVGHHQGLVGRKKTLATNCFKRNRLNADSIHIRAPVPFNLNRLLLIYRYVSGTWADESGCDSGLLFQRTVRSLVQHGIFKSGSEDWLKGGAKLNCHAPLDLVQVIAHETNVKLEEVLYA